MNVEDMNTENSAVIEFAKETLKAEFFDFSYADKGTAPVLILPSGKSIESLKRFFDEYATAPDRRKGTATLETLASFIEHANRFKGPHSAVFAQRDKTSFVSVLNYHEAGTAGAPRFGDHRGVYKCPVSPEWQAWTNVSGKSLTQRDFAEFVEEHVMDLIDPGNSGDATWDFAEKLSILLAKPAQIVELSRGLSINIESRIAEAVTLSSGESRLRFETEHRDASGAPLNVPGGFAVGIPVFRGGDVFKLPARLRMRADKEKGAITWTIKLYRADVTLDEAFGEACEHIRDDTSLPLFMGSPES